jgi:hypothetical protein
LRAAIAQRVSAIGRDVDGAEPVVLLFAMKRKANEILYGFLK